MPFINETNSSSLSVEDGIAVLPVHGVLLRRSDTFDVTDEATSYETVEKNLQAALDNASVKGILLDIDSPGGEVAGLFDVADMIYQARSLKPIWAIANDTAYSAAYAIASAASKVFVTSTGSVGSIGVIATHMDQSAYNERKGFKITSITAGNHKNDYSPHQPLSEEAKRSLQAEVNRLYDMFVDLVSRNRNVSPDLIRRSEAGLFYGHDAITQKLAEYAQSFHQTLNDLKKHVSSRTLSSPPLLDKDKRMSNLKKPSASHDGCHDDAIEIQTHPDTELRSEDLTPTPTLSSSYHHQPLAPSHNRTDRQALMTEAVERGREHYRQQALEIIELCTLARLPEHIVPFLKQNLSVDQARETLLNQLAQNSQEAIFAHTNPDVETHKGPSWVIKEAKLRAGTTDNSQGQ